MSLADFLLARIAEDEEVARAAIGTAAFGRQSGRWQIDRVRDQYGEVPIVFAVTESGGRTQAANLEAAWEADERGAHIARHDPARILGECEAKRRIVGRHDVVDAAGGCAFCGEPAPCEHLRFLAAVYAGHPDFDPAWKVER